MDIFWNLFFNLVSQGYKITFKALYPSDFPILTESCMEIEIRKGQWQKRIIFSKEMMEQSNLDADSLLYYGIKRAVSEIEEHLEKEASE